MDEVSASLAMLKKTGAEITKAAVAGPVVDPDKMTSEQLDQLVRTRASSTTCRLNGLRGPPTRRALGSSACSATAPAGRSRSSRRLISRRR